MTRSRPNWARGACSSGPGRLPGARPVAPPGWRVGNGVMVAFEAKEPAQVDRLHALALANGGSCEGAPGPRGDGGFYAAYFRDPDGNKLNAFVMGTS